MVGACAAPVNGMLGLLMPLTPSASPGEVESP